LDCRAQSEYRPSLGGKGDPNLIRAYAAVALKPDALHAFSTPAVAAFLQNTQTIPVVFVG
jgi:hypothetical protein